jgi:hypothetical protein
MLAHLIRGRAPVSALSLAAAALSVGLMATQSRAQAAADLCANAPLIVGNHQYVGNNFGATSDIAQSPCSVADSNDVWYSYIAPLAGDYTIDTLYSELDTTLAVYTACGGSILACNDDADPDNFDYTSIVTLTLTQGQSIRIRVAGYAFATGNFELYITAPVPTVTMGACCRGSACAVEGSDVCTGAGTFYGGAASACNATGNFTTPCCKADFNRNGTIEIQDIFDFLNAWFASDPRCDINASGGVEIQDIFDFLNAWFAGC